MPESQFSTSGDVSSSVDEMSASCQENDTSIHRTEIGSSFDQRQDRVHPEDNLATSSRGLKRKESSSEVDIAGNRLDQPANPGNGSIPGQKNLAKKPRLEEDKKPSQRIVIPLEIWHHVCLFLDPKSLGAMLRVNKALYSSLSFKSPGPTSRSSEAQGVLQPLCTNTIWSLVRKSCFPGMPRPLTNMTEMDMWKLIGQTNCQKCGKPDQLSVTNLPPWERGPGNCGVRIYWPFTLRACSQCFLEYTKKGEDLVLSSFPSFLLPGLSFVHLTPSMNLVSSVTLRSTNIPPDLHLSISKYYFNPEIDSLINEFHHVESLGPAALEEWIKGLESLGKRKLGDAFRWEQWENSGGLRDLGTRHRGRSPWNRPSSHRPSVSPGILGSPSGSNDQVKSPGSISDSHYRKPKHGLTEFHPVGQINTSHRAVDRSLHDVDMAKDSRRSEIERRCLELHPPLDFRILSHMESFQAAIQIPHELTEKEWEYLKPRLLAQRELAETKEQERLRELQLLQAKTEERRQQEERQKEDQKSLDDEWETSQRLVRDQISLYADEIIEKKWNGGTSLTKEKCAAFAADVLMHVRTRFYAHITEEDAISRASGPTIKLDTADAPPTRQLVLDNMKWIFDNKIRPLTQQLAKEIFLCNGCENTSRYYGFEAVVQHYASKHTTTLSFGKAIVSWSAEWPEKPPFHPNPDAAKALVNASGGLGKSHGFQRPQGMVGMFKGTPEQRHSIISDPNPSSRPYGRSPFTSPYTFSTHGPFPPPSPRTSPYYPGPMFPPPPSPGMEAAIMESSSAYGSPYQHHVVPTTYPQNISQATYTYPSPAYGSSPSNHGPLYKPPQSGSRNAAMHSRSTSHTDKYQSHMDSIAQTARDVWNALSRIKELPNSVRAHVLIYHVTDILGSLSSTDEFLSLFIDGLNKHPQMKPMRSLTGLACKICSNTRNPEFDPMSGDSRLFSLPALLGHFLSAHLLESKYVKAIGSSENPLSTTDWKTDVIALPDAMTLKSLQDLPSMDESKMRIIASALPGVFHASLGHLPPETFVTKSSPAMHQAYVVNHHPNIHQSSVHHTNNVNYSPASRHRQMVDSDTVPMDSMSERSPFPPEPVSRHGSPIVPLLPANDGRGYSRGSHYVARSPRVITLRARSPRYVRVQEDWAYREDELDELNSGHHGRYYIPVSTRSVALDHSDHSYRPADHYERDVMMQQQQRAPRHFIADRQPAGQEALEGSAFSSHSSSGGPGHEDLKSAGADINAAEQFLNSFVPGQDGSSENSRNDSAPAYYSQDDGWAQRWGEHSSSAKTHDSAPRESRPRARSPSEVVPLRSYGRKPSGSTTGGSTIDSAKVTAHVGPSRFERYEALRQESLRLGSESPSLIKEDSLRDAPPLYYDDQDPRAPQSRLPPQQKPLVGERERKSSGRVYVGAEREDSITTNTRRNFRNGGVRESAFYDDTMEY